MTATNDVVATQDVSAVNPTAGENEMNATNRIEASRYVANLVSLRKMAENLKGKALSEALADKYIEIAQNGNDAQIAASMTFAGVA